MGPRRPPGAVLFGLDTNILVYAVEAGGDKARAADLIVRRAVATRRCVLSLQNLGEFYHACARKRRVPADEAARRALDLSRLFVIAAPSLEDARLAVGEAAAGRFSYWDALLLATLGRAGCSLLLSEDMHDGAVLAGARVRNPFVGDGLPPDLDLLLA